MTVFTARKYRGPNAILDDFEAKIIHSAGKSVSACQGRVPSWPAGYMRQHCVSIIKVRVLYKAGGWLPRILFAKSILICRNTIR